MSAAFGVTSASSSSASLLMRSGIMLPCGGRTVRSANLYANSGPKIENARSADSSTPPTLRLCDPSTLRLFRGRRPHHPRERPLPHEPGRREPLVPSRAARRTHRSRSGAAPTSRPVARALAQSARIGRPRCPGGGTRGRSARTRILPVRCRRSQSRSNPARPTTPTRAPVAGRRRTPDDRLTRSPVRSSGSIGRIVATAPRLPVPPPCSSNRASSAIHRVSLDGVAESVVLVQQAADRRGVEADRPIGRKRIDRAAAADRAPSPCRWNGRIDQHHRNPAELAVADADAGGDQQRRRRWRRNWRPASSRSPLRQSSSRWFQPASVLRRIAAGT